MGILHRLRRYFAGWIVPAFCFLAGARLAAQSAPAYPQWWTDYGVLSGTTRSDYAAVNQGQVKDMAVAAVSELDNDLAQFGGAGSTLDNLAVALSATTAQTSDYATVNLGQLKALAQPFYDRLLSLGYTEPPLSNGTYPWIGGVANDYAVANIGQVKNLFSFDVLSDTNGDGIPDWWEQKYAISGTGTVPWSGGQVTYLQAFQHGLNPVDYYSGHAPVLAIVSGGGQTGSPGGFVPAPLIVLVSDTAGNPLVGAPVTFTVTSGGGTLQQSSGGSPGTAQTALADGNGNARAYFQLPSTETNTSQITVTTGTGSSAATPVYFNESSDDGSGQYGSPFAPGNLTVTLNADGTITLTWTNNADNAVDILVQQQLTSGTWQQIGPALSATTTSDTISDTSGPFRVVAETPSTSGSGGSNNQDASTPQILPIPQQNYAVIDMSGTSTNGNDVSMVALDDSNHAAFEYTVLSGGTTGGIATGTCCVYTWAGGSVSALSPFGTIKNASMTNVSGSSIQVSMGLVPVTLLANGEVFGNGYQTDNELAYSESSGAVGWTSVPSPYETFSFYGYDYTDYLAVSPDGSRQALGGFYVLSLGNPVYESTGAGADFIVASGSAVAFAPNSPYGTSGTTVTDTNQYFQPYAVNANGWALGVGGTTGDVFESYVMPGSDTAYQIWNGSAFTSFSSTTDTPLAINDANEVIVTSSTAGGYLWTSGSGVQPISQLLPTQYQNEVSNISPIVISGTDANGRVGIIFSAQYQTDSQGDQGTGTFLLTLASGTTTLQQVALPSNVSLGFSAGMTSSTGTILNSQGLIAGIGNITTGTGSAAVTGTNHALLLLPAQLSVTFDYQGSGWNDSTSILTSPEAILSAKVKQIPGLNITVNIVQDANATGTITYDNNSWVYCSTPGFLADDGTNSADDPVETGTDAEGNITATFIDAPNINGNFNDNRPYDLKVQYAGSFRDFLTVQIGSGPAQVVAEVKWSNSLAATFKPDNRTTPATHYPTVYPGQDDIIQTTPAMGRTTSGGVSTDEPVSPPRQPTANGYTDDLGNWNLYYP